MNRFQSFEKYNSSLNPINTDISINKFWTLFKDMIHLKDMFLDLFCNGLFQVRLQLFAVFSGLNIVQWKWNDANFDKDCSIFLLVVKQNQVKILLNLLFHYLIVKGRWYDILIQSKTPFSSNLKLRFWMIKKWSKQKYKVQICMLKKYSKLLTNWRTICSRLTMELFLKIKHGMLEYTAW